MNPIRVSSTISVAIAVVVFTCLTAVAKGWSIPTTATIPPTTMPSGALRCRLAEILGVPSLSKRVSTRLSFSATTEDSSSSAESIEDVSAMRLSEIKAELRERKINFSDCFDKESMVSKLIDARTNNIDNSEPKSCEPISCEPISCEPISCEPKSCEPTTPSTKSDSGDREEESTSKATSKVAEDFDREKAQEELRGMRVRGLREELGRRQISRAGLFEKEDLVNALLEARAIAAVFSGSGLMTPGEVSDFSASDAQTEIDHPGSLLLLDVYATWCGPCQMVAPILKEIAAEQGDSLRVVKVDSDKNQELASKLKVTGFPTLVLFQDGNEIDRLAGGPTKDQLMGWIESCRR